MRQFPPPMINRRRLSFNGERVVFWLLVCMFLRALHFKELYHREYHPTIRKYAITPRETAPSQRAHRLEKRRYVERFFPIGHIEYFRWVFIGVLFGNMM